jgi:peptidyl-prolyl cis-trans isomerase C
MKKLILGSLVITSALFANSDVLATVNGEKVTKAEINEVLKSQGITYDKLPDRYKRELLDSIITQALLIQKAEQSGIENTKEYKKELEKVKKQLAAKFFLNKAVVVNEEEAKEFYYENRGMFKHPAEVKARHILVKSKEEAEKIINELKNIPKSELEQKFIELAKKKSIGPSSRIGGELGWFSRDRMIPAFSKAAFNLEKGEFTLKPVHTRYGWHIIYVEDKKPQGYIPFKQVKVKIMQILKVKKLRNYLNNLKKQANIKYYN